MLKEALKAEERAKAQQALAEFEKLQSQVTSVNAIASSNIAKFSGTKRKAEPEVAGRKLGEGYATSKLPSFWIPELTPAIAAPKPAASVNTKLAQCTAAEPHTISMKKMVSIKFATSSESADPVCPACLKVMTNASNPVLLITCGHVVCDACATRFVAPSNSCYTCQAECPHDSDRLPLHHEGTGYAAGGGRIIATRFDLAFQ